MQIAAPLYSSPILSAQTPSKPVPATIATASPTVAESDQRADVAESASPSQYDASVDGLSALLSTQGEAIMPPNLTLALLALQTSGGSVEQCSAAASADAAPVTASQAASQMINSLGSNGVLTLADVEVAENGSTDADAATSLDSNCDGDIAADFTQLSGGTDTMTASQLASAIQRYMDTQNQHEDGFGSRIVSDPA
jgi:hypothetical protein